MAPLNGDPAKPLRFCEERKRTTQVELSKGKRNIVLVALTTRLASHSASRRTHENGQKPGPTFIITEVNIRRIRK